LLQLPFLATFAAKNNTMLRFISFGSGSCGNCYYLCTDKYGLLIDLGISIRKLKKYFLYYGLKLAEVKSVLVTHDHADHVKAVGMFCNTLNIPAYTTAIVHEGISRNYVVRKKIDTANIRAIAKNKPFTLGDMTITAFTVPHDSMDNVGYQIEACGTIFCLMTDAGHITEEMAELISKANYLVIEANHDEEMLRNGTYSDFLKARVASQRGHLSNNQCANALINYASKNLKHVWLCHLSQENNHPELARKTVEQALLNAERFDGAHIKLDVLRRNIPSEVFELK